MDDGRTFTCSGSVSYNPVARRTVKIDGDLGGWDLSGGIDISTGDYVKIKAPRNGDADLSGHAWLCWDAENLYFAARIRDDIFCQEHTGFSVWKGDSIQIGISASMPWVGGEGAFDTSEYDLSLTKKGPEFYRSGGPGPEGLVKDVHLVVKREGDITTYECAIPWKELAPLDPSKGAFSFGIFVNDNDGQYRKGYLKWADIKSLNRMQPFQIIGGR